MIGKDWLISESIENKYKTIDSMPPKVIASSKYLGINETTLAFELLEANIFASLSNKERK